MIGNLYDRVQPVAFLTFCSTRPQSSRRRMNIYAREQVDVGRDNVKQLLGTEALTISTHHLRLRCVVYEDDDEQAIAPMIYFRVLSSNSVELKRPGIGHNTGVAVSRGHGDILLGAGDVLCLTTEIYLLFQYHASVELEDSLDGLQRAEAKSFADQYFLSGRKLGAGGQASVYIAVKQCNKRQLACKAVPLPKANAHVQDGCDRDLRLTEAQREAKLSKERQVLAREYTILEKLNHPNIVALDKVICATYNAYIFQELITGGDLSSYIDQNGPLAEPQAAAITLQLLKAVQHLHNNGFVHRDIKPENILMTSWREGTRVVLTDFGQARAIEGANSARKNARSLRMQSLVGTYGYTAPEIFHQVRQSVRDTGYNKAVDVWSMGCVTAVLLTGNTLFSQDETDLANARKTPLEDSYSERYDVNVIDNDTLWVGISRKAKDFVKRCLAQLEDRRLTAEQALKHEWFTNKHYVAELEAAYERAIADWQPRQQRGSLIDFMTTKSAVSATSKSSATQSKGTELKSKHFQAAQKPVVLPVPAMKKTVVPIAPKPHPAYQHAMSREPKEATSANPLSLQPLSLNTLAFASPIKPPASNPLSNYTIGGSTGSFSICNYGPPQTQYTVQPQQLFRQYGSVAQSPSMLDEPTQAQLTSPAKVPGHLHHEERVVDSQETQMPTASEMADRPRKKVCR